MHNELKTIIEQAWENRALLQDPAVQQAIRQVVELVDKGELRTAEPVDPAKSEWKVNEWVKKAVILYFPIQPMRKMQAGELEWYDKMEVKHGYEEATIARRINIEEARETAENRPENPLVYVEGMGGVVTEMTFSPEFFAELEAEIAKGNADGKNFKTLAFSQVRMSIYFNDSDYEWEKIADGTAGDILRMTDQMNAYPARLGMYTNYKTLTPISDYAYIYEQNYGSSVTLAYNGKINRSRGCYVMDITGYMQQLWNSYMEAKADAGGEVANIDWDKVKNRSVYIGPEAYGLYTTSFGVLQGMPTQAGTAEPNNAPIRFSMAYNLIK